MSRFQPLFSRISRNTSSITRKSPHKPSPRRIHQDSRRLAALAQEQRLSNSSHTKFCQNPDSLGYSPWTTTNPVRLNKENYLNLLYGKTPSLWEPGFVSPKIAWEYEKRLSPQLTPYTHNTGPLLTKVGVAQFEYQAQTAEDFSKRNDEKNRYFIEAKKWINIHNDLGQSTGVNLWRKIFLEVSSLFPEWDIEVASEGPNKNYFSGIFRALNHATHIHCDWSPYDSLTEDWIVNQVECQVVFNLYLAPVKGGRTVVHDVHWTEDALRFRDPESYGYYPEIVENSRKSYVVPEVGGLGFFNSRNMHEVEKVEAEPMEELGLPYRPRLTLSSFMGLIPSSKTGGRPKLIFWS